MNKIYYPKFRRYALLISGILFSSLSFGQDLKKTSSHGFIENKGQITDQQLNTNKAVLYGLSLPGLNVGLKASGFSYTTYATEDVGEDESLKHPGMDNQQPVPHKYNYKFHRVDVEFLGANPTCRIEALEQAADYTMYYTPGTPEGGVKAHSFGKIIYQNLYPGIDLEFMASPGKNKPVEYNFIVHPGADVSAIRMRYTGALEAAIKEGLLVLKLAHGELKESIPASWLKESGKAVSVAYSEIERSTNSITIGLVSPNNTNGQTLIIDPTPNLDWGTYYGGSDYEDVAGEKRRK